MPATVVSGLRGKDWVEEAKGHSWAPFSDSGLQLRFPARRAFQDVTHLLINLLRLNTISTTEVAHEFTLFRVSQSLRTPLSVDFLDFLARRWLVWV